MKKRLKTYVGIVFVLLLFLALIGCGGGRNGSDQAEAIKKIMTETLKFDESNIETEVDKVNDAMIRFLEDDEKCTVYLIRDENGLQSAFDIDTIGRNMHREVDEADHKIWTVSENGIHWVVARKDNMVVRYTGPKEAMVIVEAFDLK